MKRINVTPWFPCTEKPVRIGFYERSRGKKHGILEHYWNGHIWLDHFSSKYPHQNQHHGWWRGVIKKC